MSLKISAIILLLMTFLFLGEGIWPGRTYYIRDITYLFAPLRMFAGQCLARGEIPLWNHYSNWGMPFLANWQSGIFSVGNLFFYFFNFNSGLKLFLIFSFFLAGLGAYLFSRRFFSSLTSVIVAIVFIGGGFLLSKLEFLSSTAVYPWLFFLLLLNNVFGLAIAIALAFFGGHQAFFYLIALTFVFKVFFCFPKRNFSFLNNFFLSGLIALCLVSVQLLPTVELFFNSTRRQGLELDVSSAESYNLKQLSGIISPVFVSWLKCLPEKKIFGEKYPWAQTAYLGIVTTCLSIYGIFFAPVKIRYLSFFLILFGVVFSLGNNSIFYKFFYQHFFVFKFFRYPGPLIILTVIGLLILFGYGLEAVKNKRRKFLFAGLIVGELLFYCWPAIQKTTDSNYFYSFPETIRFFQKNLNGQRFILSPETELNRKFFFNQSNPWQQVRSFLTGYIALPYRVFGAYSSGEPLIPKLSFSWIDQFYQLSPEKAISRIEETNIGAMIARRSISQFSRIKKYPVGELLIYRLANKHQLLEFITGQKIDYVIRDGEILCQAGKQKPGELIFYETFYPGWYLYAGGKKITPHLYKNTFQIYNIEDIAPKGNFCLTYRPRSFFYGAGITFFALLILGGNFSLKLYEEK